MALEKRHAALKLKTRPPYDWAHLSNIKLALDMLTYYKTHPNNCLRPRNALRGPSEALQNLRGVCFAPAF